jgi:hypothetical protein
MYVYGMRMFSERLQILVSPEQRRRLEAEAASRGTSVASVIRDAVDERLRGPTPEERMAAVERIARRQATYVPPDELNRLIASQYDEPWIDELVSELSKREDD